MPEIASISFSVEPLEEEDSDSLALTPMIDGRSLVDIAREFELSQGFEPAGGYGGVVPSSFNFGDLTKYYLGTEPRQWPEPGRACLLGCSCGELGCWPLEAAVTVTAATVTWSSMTQEHRPNRSYEDLGAFTFDRQSYDAAVLAAIARLD